MERENAQEIEKQLEEIRAVVVNIKKIENGDKVEDASVTLEKQLQSRKNDLSNIQAKKKRMQDELNRNKRSLDQGKLDLEGKR